MDFGIIDASETLMKLFKQHGVTSEVSQSLTRDLARLAMMFRTYISPSAVNLMTSLTDVAHKYGWDNNTPMCTCVINAYTYILNHVFDYIRNTGDHGTLTVISVSALQDRFMLHIARL